VLLPAYQAAEFIQLTLDSISSQTSTDFEAIVSVDASDDSTLDICLKHAARDARFKVFRQASRLGYVGNCNFLLSKSDADLAMFAFHDDILAPAYVEKLAAALGNSLHAALSYSDLEVTNTDGTREQWSFSALEGISDRVVRGVKMLGLPRGWWVPNRGMFRMSSARKVGGLKTHASGEFSTDWPWLFHLALTGGFVRIEETLCFKYYKAGSLSRKWKFTAAQWFDVGCACMREIWNSDLTGDEKMRLAQPLMIALERTMRRKAPEG